MEPRLETINEKKLIGKRLRMSVNNDRTFELWRSFMPRRKEITNAVNSDLINMRVYDPNLTLKDLNLDTEMDKWASVEVADFDTVPEDMETHTINGGLYAVFDFKGTGDPYTFIFGTWLPNSKYTLDNREHFDVLGAKYKGNDPDSEEELWIPIKQKE